ncbi:MAG: ATP-dependent DNA helicase [Candidatus Beckwithbacteria bacterium]|nr:ATP-dependent DNA helicase [Candidatus Beckwithbacteria bacterium]
MKLNSSQQLAVDTIEGPVMVIAGPGTGKTQIIAERIANILKKTDTSPDAILALTFTESGAKAMRERLTQTIGPTAYYVNIFTFHSFCSSVIQEFPDHFVISPQMEPLSDLERVEIFHEILTSHNFDYLKPVNTPFYYTPALIKAIQDLKREAVSPEKFKSIISSEKDKKLPELLKIYSLYQQALIDRGRYDFEDMINLVVAAFKSDQTLLRIYQERLQYFLVDEYQDTNSAQNQVVDLLASYWGDQANVFVVGDSNQSIFRFQGASLENIVSFTKTYPQAKIISLDQNYRSTQTILDTSFHLIQKNHLKIEDVVKTAKSKLISQKVSPELPINLVRLPSEIVELYWAGRRIKKLINQGVKPEEIAVLYRHNADALDIADLFSKLGIPTDIEGGGNVLEDPTIVKLLTLLKAINLSPKNLEDLDLFTLLHYEFLKFNSLDILKLSRRASKANLSLVDVILSDNFHSLSLAQPERLIEFVKQLSQWQELNSQLTFSQFFETVIKQSGFLDWILSQPDATAKLNILNSFFSAIKRLNNADHSLKLDSFLKSLELMEINHLKISAADLDIKTNAVTLSTAHKAKGKEWNYVFIIKAIDGKWGNNRTRELIKLPAGILTHSDLEKKEKNEDERRLFYVSLTRAKKKIFISFAERYANSGHVSEAVPTMFISEIPDKFKKIILPKLNQDQARILRQFLEPVSQPTLTFSEKEFLANLVKNFKLSPTALNTFLTCAYKFKLNNLIRVPRAKASFMSFGTAVHKALENFHRQFILDDKHPSKQFLLDKFTKALEAEVLDKNESASRLKQGAKILTAYYDYYQDDFIKAMFTEKFFGYGWSKTFLGDIPLTGKIDRIDPLDMVNKTVRVVDYKTGQPQTRNAIMGKTKNSQGDYYRQLVFYKLLTKLDQTFRLEVTEAEIDFVEPNRQSGKFRQESFKISDDDLKDLRATIISAMKEIRALNFIRTTDYHQCVRCEFQRHCWPDGLPKTKQLELIK